MHYVNFWAYLLKSCKPFFSKTLRDTKILRTPLDSACQIPYKTAKVFSEAKKKLKFVVQCNYVLGPSQLTLYEKAKCSNMLKAFACFLST